jgi:hypothetical protein
VASSDTSSPEQVVAALYEVISGPADERRDWPRFRSLFVGGARFLIRGCTELDATVHEGEWSVEGFIEAGSEEYRHHGFWEREIWSRSEQYGSIAHVFSTYESRVGSAEAPPVRRGINSIQCLREKDGWKIAHLIFDLETESNPIPPPYLGAKPGPVELEW